MVETLLQFTRAERDRIWYLHVHSFFLSMLPYFIRYDHHSYGKLGTIYLRDMMQLPKPVLDEFQQGTFVVKRSQSSIRSLKDHRVQSMVDVDHGQEWLIRAGIVGITKTNSALSRWALSYNLRSSMPAQTMYSQFNQDSLMHDESRHGRRTPSTPSQHMYQGPGNWCYSVSSPSCQVTRGKTCDWVCQRKTPHRRW